MTTIQETHDLASLQGALIISLNKYIWTEVFWVGMGLVIVIVVSAVFLQLHNMGKRRTEQLRKQIAEDFHDELGSRLTIISMYSELISRELPANQPLIQNYLQKISQASGDLYQATKDMLWTLDPAQDSLDDLLIKIKDFGEELFEDSEKSFAMRGIQGSTQGIRLSIEYKRHLLLIFKEALTNVLRHASATEVELTVSIRNGMLFMVLRDNGHGFELSRIKQGEGIKNMKNRTEKINGEIHLSASPAGTVVSVNCPLLRR